MLELLLSTSILSLAFLVLAVLANLNKNTIPGTYVTGVSRYVPRLDFIYHTLSNSRHLLIPNMKKLQ